MEHKHGPEEERRTREAALDETLAETLTASETPSTLQIRMTMHSCPLATRGPHHVGNRPCS